MLGTLKQREIQEVLRGNMLGRIGCRSGDEIYIVPVTYIYADQTVTCHSYEGTKVEWMRRNPRVGFEVEAITDQRNWKCVTAQGVFEELTDQAEIAAAAAKLNDMALAMKASLTALPPSEAGPREHLIQGRSVFYTIRLTKVSGRFERDISGIR